MHRVNETDKQPLMHRVNETDKQPLMPRVNEINKQPLATRILSQPLICVRAVRYTKSPRL
jgi:hypothetical protein